MSKADNRLILLGTKGGPKIGPDTAWPTSNILVVEGHPYLIDAGLGVTRQVWKPGSTRLTSSGFSSPITTPTTTWSWAASSTTRGSPAWWKT